MTEKKAADSPELWRGRKSQSAILLRICAEGCYWRDRAGVPHATIANGESFGYLEVHSSAFRQWIAKAYFEKCGGAATPSALNDAVAFAAAKGTFAGDVKDVFLRVGRDGDEIVIDTCDEAGTLIRVSPLGYAVDSRGRVPFRRAPSARELPVPTRGLALGDIRSFVNVADEDWPLVAGWLVAACRPEGPYPVLFLHGEQGSGKSTQARILRALVDPNYAPLRAAPRDLQDLAVCAHNNWVIALDNLSALPVWLSDALCRLSTGGGYGTRALYANDREVVFNAQRPVLVTGIEDVATRGDLIDRAIIVHLPAMGERTRRPESKLWGDFNSARASLFGALCAAVSAAMANLGRARIPGTPRLADFAAWAPRTSRPPGGHLCHLPCPIHGRMGPLGCFYVHRRAEIRLPIFPGLWGQ